MTIGIGLGIRDGVILMADGRLTDLVSNSVTSDDTNKVIQVLPTVFAIPAGITIATDQSLARLGATHSIEDEVGVILQKAANSTTEWSSILPGLTRLLPPGNANKAAMLIGGLDVNGDRFLIGLQQNVGQATQQTLSRDPAALCMVGEVDLSQFTASFLPELPFHPWGPEKPLNSNIEYCLGKMAGHIESVSRQAPSVGGTVRFVVLRAGLDPLIGRWPLNHPELS